MLDSLELNTEVKLVLTFIVGEVQAKIIEAVQPLLNSKLSIVFDFYEI